MKTVHLVVFCILLTPMLTCHAGQAAEKPPAASPANQDPLIVSKLRELIQIREKQVKLQKVLVEAGRASAEPVLEVALAEARIDLARELGQQEVVLASLRDIVQLRKQWVEHLEARNAARERAADLEAARAALITAEVRLLREQKSRR